jgi:hypothetical protein
MSPWPAQEAVSRSRDSSVHFSFVSILYPFWYHISPSVSLFVFLPNEVCCLFHCHVSVHRFSGIGIGQTKTHSLQSSRTFSKTLNISRVFTHILIRLKQHPSPPPQSPLLLPSTCPQPHPQKRPSTSSPLSATTLSSCAPPPTPLPH